MRYLILLLGLFSLTKVNGQWMLSAEYQSAHYLNWENKPLSVDPTSLFGSLNSLGLNLSYAHLPDKERQLYLLARAGINQTFGNLVHQKISSPHLGVGILFFPFNMNGDCDCPRFSQEGTFFSRGFHFSITSDAAMFMTKNQSAQFQGIFGADFGLKIPVHKDQSLAPFVGISFGTNVSNQNLVVEEKSTLNQLNIGVRYLWQ